MELSHKEIVHRWRKNRKKERTYIGLSILLLVICFLLSLCFRVVFPGFIPVETAKNLWTLLKINIAHISGSSYYLERNTIIAGLSFYAESIHRLVISVFTIFSGMALGLSGAVYQQLYHNPVASPSTIGATAGVNLGNMILVLLYSYTAMMMVLYRYIICIACTFAITFAVMIAGKKTGWKSSGFSVVEMLMIGSVLSRMVTAFNTYMMYHLSGSALIAYQELNLGVYQTFSYQSMALFFAIIIIGILLILKMRFRINAVSMDAMEARAGGVNLLKEQVIAQVLATLILAAACIQVGDVGLFALGVPHLVRYVTGADFRKVAVYSTIYGGVLFLIVRMVSSMIFLGDEPIPVNFIVSIVMIPMLFVMLTLQRRGFD